MGEGDAATSLSLGVQPREMESNKSRSELLTELRNLRTSQSRRPHLVTRIGLKLELSHSLENLNNQHGQSRRSVLHMTG